MDADTRSIEQFNKAASERLGLAYHLIPAESLRRLSQIFLEGLVKYPGAAVNGRNLGGVVGNEPWQVERFNHAVDHLLKWGEGDTTEDHLAKVMWFCSVMIAVRGLEIEVLRAEGKYKVEGPSTTLTSPTTPPTQKIGVWSCRKCGYSSHQPEFCCASPSLTYSMNSTE